MAYEPTVWKTGDVVTSGKLNKLENAVAQAGGVDEKEFLITVLFDENQAAVDVDKTFAQIVEVIDTKYLVLNIAGRKINDTSVSYDDSNNVDSIVFYSFDIVDSDGYAEIIFTNYVITDHGFNVPEPVVRKISYLADT